MKKILTIVLALCSAVLLQATKVEKNVTIKLNGESRSYRLYVPNNVKDDCPFVLSLHGASGHSTDKSPFRTDVADKAGCIVAYPQGKDIYFPVFGGTVTGWDASGEDNADVTFLKAVIEDVAKSYKIDRNRLYCCGFSNGGMMTYALTNACSDVFAAFASISGFQLNEFHFRHAGWRPVPFLHIHGKQDDFVKYSLLPTVVDEMVARTGANPVPKKTVVSGKYTKNIYEAGEGGFPFVYYEIDGMGHNDFTSNTEKNSSAQTMWDFFQQYTLDTPCDTTLKWRPRIETEGYAPKSHGWTMNSGTTLLKFGEAPNTSTKQNVYRTLQFLTGKYKLSFKSTGAEGKTITVKIEKLTGKKNAVLNATVDVGEESVLPFEVTDGWGEYKITFTRPSSTDAITVTDLAIHSLTADELANVTVETGKYGNNWASLSQWECPEWFKDAKFGIWAHWGPQCQAEDGDWYARFMYYEGSGQYNYHVSHYGNPKTFGLKDLCNAWKADQWNPQELVSLYKSVGARYFMALGNHHDNFDNWNSPYQEWNSVNVGPKQDLIKGWSDACKAEGLPLGVSIHASHAWTWLEPSQKYDGNLTKDDGAGKWWEGLDPQELYAQNHDHSTGWESSGTIHSQWEWGNGASQPSKAYKQKFQNRVLELINDYDPDMIYFDDTAMPFYGCDNQIGKNILQHYYNHSAAQHDGLQQVVVTGKQLTAEQKGYMMWDVERGIPDRPQEAYWQTCTCIGQWHYDQNVYNNNSYKSGATIVRMLIDVVSKNGNLLLSIPVKGNGTIDSKERTVLADIKAWMDINSESIYGTRMWKTFGEGPLAEAVNPMNAQGFNEGQAYSAQDVRYVTKDGAVYAIIMAWPAAGAFTFKAFSMVEPSYSGEVETVTLLGGGDIEFTHEMGGLTINVPSKKPNAIAPVFRITFKADSRNAYEKLQELISGVESAVSDAATLAQPYNTGKLSPAKLDQLRAAITKAKTLSSASSEDDCDAARETLAAAYRSFRDDGMNKGGAFNGVIDENLTTQYLIEASNFTRSAGGTSRFGKPKNWTVENFNIPNGSDGTKQGLDKYSGNDALMLGVWNDAGSNTTGDLKNARIYRKVTLPAGKYYFGAAYNTTYSISPQAYMFVSKTLCPTADIPSQSIAYYPISNCTGDMKVQGLYFQLDQETEVYMGFQANLLFGSATQEFRAEQVCLYSPKEVGEHHAEAKGWKKIDAMPEDVSQYFFAIYDHGTDNGLVHNTGNKQGSAYKTMWYEDDVYPEGNKDALWTFDAFDNNNLSGAKGDDTSWMVITNTGSPDICLQSNDEPNNWNYRTENNGEGWTDRAYVSPTLYAIPEPDGSATLSDAAYCWNFINNKGGGRLGRYDGTNEISGNATGEDVGYYDLYAILRGNYVAAAENIDKASEENPIDISYVITNADATRYNNFHAKQPVGWTLSQEDAFECEYANYLPAKVGSSYFNKWQGSGNLTDRILSQQVTGLPNGKYRLSVRTSDSVIHPGASLFANNEKADMTKLTNNTVSVVTEITDGQLTLGVELKNYQSNDCKFDHFTLEYLGNTLTGITTPKSPVDGISRIYDISGNQHSHPVKGINIINNKKVVVK